MPRVEPIGDDEIILRRIPPSSNQMGSTAPRPEGGLRAASVHLSTRPGEKGLSCTRLKQTSPRNHLDDLKLDGIDPVGWLVCRIRVSDARKLGLNVVHTPTDRDPGHVEIVGDNGAGLTLEYPNNRKTKLAKLSRILTDEEITSLRAGGILD